MSKTKDKNKDVTIEDIYHHVKCYKNIRSTIDDVNKKNSLKIKYPNISSDMSENLTKMLITNNVIFKDKFGDNGLTGVCIAKEDEKDPKNVILDSLLMSCRIIGRNIEFVYVSHIIKDLANKGYQTLTADYIPTKKNAQVEDFYDKVGLNLIENVDGTKHYSLNIANFEPKKVDYIKINTELV